MSAGADPGFPVGGGANPRGGGGAPTYDFVKSSEKLHEIEKILDRRGACTGCAPPLNPSLVCVSVYKRSYVIITYYALNLTIQELPPPYRFMLVQFGPQWNSMQFSARIRPRILLPVWGVGSIWYLRVFSLVDPRVGP